MSGDPIADILRVAEVGSVLSGGLAAGGEWAFRFRSREKIKFYLVADGGCWLTVEPERTRVRLEKGDVLLLSGPKVFVLGSSATASAQEVCPVFDNGGTFAHVGARVDCVVLVGVVSLHPSSAALFMSAMPTLLHVRAAAPAAAPMRWMVERIAQEGSSRLPAASLASSQLVSLLFIQALRAQLETPASLPPGWLRAVRDERLLTALRLMHDDPGRAWRLSALAKAAGMSRARFAARFKAESGLAPLAYLTGWRMQVACRKLRDEAAPVGDVATSLGYRSESAFSHAFKRVTGTGPRAYRDHSQRQVQAAPESPPASVAAPQAH